LTSLILTGGKVWARPGTPSEGPRTPTAVAVADGRFVAVGSDSEIERLAGRSTVKIRLQGRRVVPGFIDSHTHFVAGGFGLAGVQLRDAATPAEFARRIGNQAAKSPKEWILGGTWDHELWGGELPRRDWIDPLTPGTPVFVSRLDAHMALANGRALDLAGVTPETPDPAGGAIVRYPDGRPSGVLKDAAQGLVERVIPPPSEGARDRALQAAMRLAVAHGVTLIADMGSWDDLATYRRALARRELTIRAYAVVPIATWRQLAEFVAREGWGDRRLFWGGVKGFVDGSLGSTTAWFYEPYSDAPETCGLTVADPNELRRDIMRADAAQLQVIVHAIGDRANDWLLDVYRDAGVYTPMRDRRMRVEHAQHLTPAAMRRFAELGVVASMQPYHAIDDGRWAERRLGRPRMGGTYAFRSLLDAGARLAFGSDWTVAPLDPLSGIYAAVTRRTIDGANPGGWCAEQRITVEEALTAYTVGGAYANGQERVLGTIEPGKHADLVVLSADICAIDPALIGEVKVDMTMVEGQIVYQRGTGIGTAGR
jgi:predicted amidohydrolase YtcJ